MPDNEALYEELGRIIERERSAEPPPAEIICSLDLMDYELRGFGVRASLTGKKRRKAQLADAARLLDEGVPFILDGRRIPGRNEGTQPGDSGDRTT